MVNIHTKWENSHAFNDFFSLFFFRGMLQKVYCARFHFFCHLLYTRRQEIKILCWLFMNIFWHTFLFFGTQKKKAASVFLSIFFSFFSGSPFELTLAKLAGMIILNNNAWNILSAFQLEIFSRTTVVTEIPRSFILKQYQFESGLRLLLYLFIFMLSSYSFDDALSIGTWHNNLTAMVKARTQIEWVKYKMKSIMRWISDRVCLW